MAQSVQSVNFHRLRDNLWHNLCVSQSVNFHRLQDNLWHNCVSRNLLTSTDHRNVGMWNRLSCNLLTSGMWNRLSPNLLTSECGTNVEQIVSQSVNFHRLQEHPFTDCKTICGTPTPIHRLQDNLWHTHSQIAKQSVAQSVTHSQIARQSVALCTICFYSDIAFRKTCNFETQRQYLSQEVPSSFSSCQRDFFHYMALKWIYSD